MLINKHVRVLSLLCMLLCCWGYLYVTNNRVVVDIPHRDAMSTYDYVQYTRSISTNVSRDVINMSRNSCVELSRRVLRGDDRGFVDRCHSAQVVVEDAWYYSLDRLSVVTSVDYGAFDYAVDHPYDFFTMVSPSYAIMRYGVEMCDDLELVRNDNIEMITHHMVGDLLVYDVRVTYVDSGIVSVRYFANKQDVVRYDYNFDCSRM